MKERGILTEKVTDIKDAIFLENVLNFDGYGRIRNTRFSSGVFPGHWKVPTAEREFAVARAADLGWLAVENHLRPQKEEAVVVGGTGRSAKLAGGDTSAEGGSGTLGHRTRGW